MPRGKDLALAERDKRIMQLAAEGWSYQKIADEIGISKQRVGQIVLSQYDTFSPDENRAWGRAILERMIEEMLPLVLGPGKRMISPKGPLFELDDDGEPDFSKPLYDRHANREVMDSIVKGLDRLAKMYGMDPWRITDKEENPELDQYLVWVQGVAQESKRNLDRISELEAKLAQYERAIEPVHEAVIVDDPAPDEPATGPGRT